MLLSAAGGANWLIATSRPSLEPFASIGSGALQPLAPLCCAAPSPCLADPALPPCSPFHSLGRVCQRSPRPFPVSLLHVGSTRRRATALAVGRVRPSGHLQTCGGGHPLKRRLMGPGMSTCRPRPRRGHTKPSACPFPQSVLLAASGEGGAPPKEL